jgi:hypothetical protein
MIRSIAFIALFALLAACSTFDEADSPFAMTEAEQAFVSQGMVVKAFPAEDPGAPFYARVTPMLNQFFVFDGQLVIPFFRDTDCIPEDFNLLELFHFPSGPGNLGAFECDLYVWGRLLIEADAPMGTFPKLVNSWGDNVPIWIVEWDAFQAAMQDGPITMDVLEGLNPLVGTATRFHETLMPRDGEHRIVINASGQVADGRRFNFHVTHLEDQTRSIRLVIR